jgi:hypothetical protein
MNMIVDSQVTNPQEWDTEPPAVPNILQVDGANDSSEEENSGDDEVSLMLQPPQFERIGQADDSSDQVMGP